MHLHEVEKHLIEALNQDIISEDEYLELAGALRDADELMQKLPWVSKRDLLGLSPIKRVVEHEATPLTLP